MYIFYPSCNYTIASPKNAKKIRDFLKETMDVAGCCLRDKREIKEEDVGLYICQHCRETIESKIETKSLWVYLDELEDLEYPDYHHEKMVLQDCWRDREHPEIHQAVRNILKKMNIDVIESKRNKEDSVYCGTLHYETKDPELLEKLKEYPDTKISELPLELQKELMEDNFKEFDPSLKIIVDCNRCLKGVELTGRSGVHLMDLLVNEWL